MCTVREVLPPGDTARGMRMSGQSKPWPNDSYDETPSSPMQRALHALFYTYMNPILKNGASLHRQRKKKKKEAAHDAHKENADGIKELSKEDVYNVPTSMEAQRLADLFWSAHSKQQAKAGQNERSAAGEGRKRKRSKSKSSAYDFLRVLWVLSKPTYVAAGVWQLVALLCQCTLPLLVREILLRLESSPGQNFRRDGLPLAFLIFAISLLDGIANERQKFLSFQTGITLRGAVVSAAQEHVLHMSPSGRAGLTSGEINNLIAVDAQKLFELTQEGHYSWSCPLAMVIVSALLIWEIGLSAIVGIITMALIVPLSKIAINKMIACRTLRVKAADARVESTSTMLMGMKFTKLNRYEEKFIDRVMTMRRKEVKFLRREMFYFGLTIVGVIISPVIASGFTFVFYTLIDDQNILTPSMTFTSLFLFMVLRFPINFAGKLAGKAAQGLHACHRFNLFFERDSVKDAVAAGEVFPIEAEDLSVNQSLRPSVPLVDVKADFSVGAPDKSDSFKLSNIEMTVHRSQIMCVVGPVASGKTTLVQGLIGDLAPTLNGTGMRYNVSGQRVAYAPQIPFILNATVRDNILFGEPFDKERYNRVLEACCLRDDIETFHFRDLTQIGERGVTLSGGQKQRLSLARVAYSQPDIAVLDDPLSALDAGTLQKVFGRLFNPSDGKGLFKNAAVILVTHASHFLSMVDSILVLVDGNQVFKGQWDDLFYCHPDNKKEADAIESIRASVQEDHSQEEASFSANTVLDGSSATVNDVTEEGNKDGGNIMTMEERSFGISKTSTWLRWFQHAGGVFFIVTLTISMSLDRGFYVVTEYWLAKWTSGSSESVYIFNREYPPQTEGQSQYIVTYLLIFTLSIIATWIRTVIAIGGGMRCAIDMFVLMLNRLVYAPMSFFDTTPVGRLMNRFTHDTETLDVTLVGNMLMLMASAGWMFTGIILQSIILPWQLFAIAIIICVYGILVLHYRKSAVDLQRLDATSRSPIQAQISEAIDGGSTMRAFGKSSFFSNIFREALDENSGMMMNFMALHRWLSVRIQILGSFAVFFAISFVAAFNDVLNISPGIAAILIIWSANFTISLSFFVQGISDSEASMTSMERVMAMTEIPQEEEKEFVGLDVAPSWPKSGKIEFNNVSLRYRPGLPLSLDGLSFTLKSGQRCGVVGRTGAGKSTLAAALFRLVEIESGKIVLDGVDLSKVPLSNVRGRHMTMIPQEPVLFPGTVKECLDPFGDYSDEQVMEALDSVRGASRGLRDINGTVDEGGRNFSVGERQLLCLARAMLASPRLLFLDEATASVDGETDAHIQTMLRSRFQGSTLITIAHRLHTIVDYDVILCIDKGRAAEFGTPAELLARNGLFAQLVESTGKESAIALRSMILNAAQQQ